MINSEQSMNDIAELKKLLLDSHLLDELSSYRDEVNIFDVLKISNTEIRHSNMLSWLFDPLENHGLGDSFLKKFIQWFVNNNDSNEFINLLLINYHSFTVLREFHNIDIMLLSEEEKIVICIENKLYSGEHSNQLKRYRKIINERYPDYEHYYVFLSIYGEDSSSPDIWKPIGYETIIDIIEDSIKHKSLQSEVLLLINHYLSTVRRIVMGDTKVIELCNEIYRKHKYALDLIYDNRADVSGTMMSTIHDWLDEWSNQGLIIFDRNDCGSKSYITFHTANMDKIIVPESELNESNKSGWNNRYHYSYHIINQPTPARIVYEFSSKSLSDSNYDKALQIQQLINNKPFNDNWQWCRVTNWGLSKRQIETVDDFESVAEDIKKEIYKIITSDIQEFEEHVLKMISTYI